MWDHFKIFLDREICVIYLNLYQLWCAFNLNIQLSSVLLVDDWKNNVNFFFLLHCDWFSIIFFILQQHFCCKVIILKKWSNCNVENSFCMSALAGYFKPYFRYPENFWKSHSSEYLQIANHEYLDFSALEWFCFPCPIPKLENHFIFQWTRVFYCNLWPGTRKRCWSLKTKDNKKLVWNLIKFFITFVHNSLSVQRFFWSCLWNFCSALKCWDLF